jgi:hypothetical protein
LKIVLMVDSEDHFKLIGFGIAMKGSEPLVVEYQ